MKPFRSVVRIWGMILNGRNRHDFAAQDRYFGTNYLFILCSSQVYYRSERKLESAHEQKRFFFYDIPDNIRKNFLVTYKGVMFEGEKYLGTTDKSFEVVSIFVFPHNNDLLHGLGYEDFVFIENEIQLRYPNAVIDWKSPIKELLEKNRNH